MIKKIYNGAYLKRLDNIKQWQEMDVFKEESVSQHSYKVAVFTRVLLEDIFGNSDNIETLKFKNECVTRAIFHDWDEALILRDMSHETKYNAYNGKAIRSTLDDFSKFKAYEEFVLNSMEERNDTSDMILESVTSPCREVEKFVKLCDWLALAFYIKREESLGNTSLSEQSKKVLEILPTVVQGVKLSLTAKFKDISVLDFTTINNFFYNNAK